MNAGDAANLATLRTYLRLTPRQQEVAMLTARGIDRQEIATRLGITDETIKGHQLLVYRAFGLHGWECGSPRLELAMRFMRLGNAVRDDRVTLVRRLIIGQFAEEVMPLD